MATEILISGWRLQRSHNTTGSIGLRRWQTVDNRISFALSKHDQQWHIIPWGTHDTRILQEVGLTRVPTGLSLRQCVKVCAELTGSSATLRQLNARYRIIGTPLSIEHPPSDSRSWVFRYIDAEPECDAVLWAYVVHGLSGRSFKNLNSAVAALNKVGYRYEGERWTERVQQKSVTDDAILDERLSPSGGDFPR